MHSAISEVPALYTIMYVITDTYGLHSSFSLKRISIIQGCTKKVCYSLIVYDSLAKCSCNYKALLVVFNKPLRPWIEVHNSTYVHMDMQYYDVL